MTESGSQKSSLNVPFQFQRPQPKTVCLQCRYSTNQYALNGCDARPEGVACRAQRSWLYLLSGAHPSHPDYTPSLSRLYSLCTLVHQVVFIFNTRCVAKAPCSSRSPHALLP